MSGTHPTTELLFLAALAVPAAAAGLSAWMPTPPLALRVARVGALLGCGVDALLALATSLVGPLSAAGGWLRTDALSAYHLGLLVVVQGLSTLFADVYFADELEHGKLSRRQARVFGSLWCGALAAMTLLLLANNLGLLWVGMETTTLLTAFLIALHVSRESLEAMWKYVLICSVAVAFAFMGTLLAVASAPREGAHAALFWTGLLAAAPDLDPRLMRAAFVFLIVGYGTKAGLAPMHNWLPDAHSQAPAPVSALFSGFMLNAALYCVLRFLPIVDAVPGCSGWGRDLLVGFGLLSLLVGASFILFQRDAKRLLAYCSVEHVGLISLGIGLGGLGTFAALWHCLNHSLAKCLAFFCVGRLGQAAGSHEIARLSGAFRRSALWGTALLASFLALAGAAPFASFLSELLIAKSAYDTGARLLFGALLAGLALAFVGLMRHLIRMAWGRTEAEPRRLEHRAIEGVLVVAPTLALLILGVWLPGPFVELLETAAQIVNGATAPLAGVLR
jgi:hydrogenase-4 component F